YGTYRYFRSEAEADEATAKAKRHAEATGAASTPPPSKTPQPSEATVVRKETPTAEPAVESPHLSHRTAVTTPSPSPQPSASTTPRQPSPPSTNSTATRSTATTATNTPPPVSSTTTPDPQPTAPARIRVPPPTKSSTPPPTAPPAQDRAKPATPPATPTAGSTTTSLKALLSQVIPPSTRSDATRATPTAPASVSKRTSTTAFTPAPPPTPGSSYGAARSPNRLSLFFGDSANALAAEKAARRRSTASVKSSSGVNPLGALGLTLRSVTVEAKTESQTLGRRAGRPLSAAFQLNLGRNPAIQTAAAGATSKQGSGSSIVSPPALAASEGRGSGGGALAYLGWKRNGGPDKSDKSDRASVVEIKSPSMASPTGSSATSFVLGPLLFEKQASLEGTAASSPTSSSGASGPTPTAPAPAPATPPMSPPVQPVTSSKLGTPDPLDFGSLEEELMMEAEKRGVFRQSMVIVSPPPETEEPSGSPTPSSSPDASKVSEEATPESSPSLEEELLMEAEKRGVFRQSMVIVSPPPEVEEMSGSPTPLSSPEASKVSEEATPESSSSPSADAFATSVGAPTAFPVMTLPLVARTAPTPDLDRDYALALAVFSEEVSKPGPVVRAVFQSGAGAGADEARPPDTAAEARASGGPAEPVPPPSPEPVETGAGAGSDEQAEQRRRGELVERLAERGYGFEKALGALEASGYGFELAFEMLERERAEVEQGKEEEVGADEVLSERAESVREEKFPLEPVTVDLSPVVVEAVTEEVAGGLVFNRGIAGQALPPSESTSLSSSVDGALGSAKDSTTGQVVGVESSLDEPKADAIALSTVSAPPVVNVDDTGTPETSDTPNNVFVAPPRTVSINCVPHEVVSLQTLSAQRVEAESKSADAMKDTQTTAGDSRSPHMSTEIGETGAVSEVEDGNALHRTETSVPIEELAPLPPARSETPLVPMVEETLPSPVLPAAPTVETEPVKAAAPPEEIIEDLVKVSEVVPEDLNPSLRPYILDTVTDVVARDDVPLPAEPMEKVVAVGESTDIGQTTSLEVVPDTTAIATPPKLEEMQIGTEEAEVLLDGDVELSIVTEAPPRVAEESTPILQKVVELQTVEAAPVASLGEAYEASERLETPAVSEQDIKSVDLASTEKLSGTSGLAVVESGTLQENATSTVKADGPEVASLPAPPALVIPEYQADLDQKKLPEPTPPPLPPRSPSPVVKNLLAVPKKKDASPTTVVIPKRGSSRVIAEELSAGGITSPTSPTLPSIPSAAEDTSPLPPVPPLSTSVVPPPVEKDLDKRQVKLRVDVGGPLSPPAAGAPHQQPRSALPSPSAATSPTGVAPPPPPSRLPRIPVRTTTTHASVAVALAAAVANDRKPLPKPLPELVEQKGRDSGVEGVGGAVEKELPPPPPAKD
ncbi:hypothetical protein HDU96_006235, partial [Phlyctochytrium bullatum]